MSCQDMEVDNDKSLEEVGFVPSGVARTPEGQAHVRQEMQQRKLQVFFFDIAFILVEDGGRPHTINF